MNKKQILLLYLFSAFVVSSFGIANVMASNSTGTLNQADQFQKRFGITLTPEQKTQMETKQKEVDTKRSEELAKWQSMTLDVWKQQEIAKINSTTQEQFDKTKERQINMLKNGKGNMGEFRGEKLDKPAE
ncbi:MAG: hypothetical protein PHD31_01550 [Candidatus Pacebacteria bacterium]|nr:hypothetical protein [Candidatus Paceibacterota bacterium]